ncbi:Trk-type K+ transport system, membrane component [Algoriphagus alkaliphilus]|uniref:Trk-type K+ transport system, membrane component n=1 Tax=Algoriphagus alkaliphilus TaxID=279824 RepID=A0A1G5VDF5_9BACT|nr:potassium transporter TrkG [Algoriphagus alkaliphilus]MBA4299736.1 ATPase [Cyclobacterium sp.]SDA43814.1 Trk-type K+ transport system, membrane component [Algoriphagus alkaliphilus]
MDFNLKTLYKFTFGISLIGLIAIVTDFGFSQTEFSQNLLDGFYFFVLAFGLISTFTRYIKKSILFDRKVFIFDFLSIVFTLWVFHMYLFVGTPFETDLLLENPIWVKIAVSMTFIREFSDLRINFKRTVLNPAQLFILSFLVIIILGSFLLMLPNATHNGISFIDALFTATSAVCVTGLVVVDTGTHFTGLGQTIIMFLIQVGGLGILTFASYFSYFFRGGTTYENQLILSDMTSSRKLGEVFSTLKYIIFITFGIEFIAGLLIYISIDSGNFLTHSDKVFFAVFHSISAFCNAGFSTLSVGLFDEGFRFNYFFQIVIILSFGLGGLGFPIVVNILSFFQYKISQLFLFKTRKNKHRPWVLNLNSRITLITTLSITFIAFFAFYFLEYNNTLSEHNGFGKIVTALFGATTPRTAGFNTIDTVSMTFPTTMMIFLLMWIGASPQSTGGGIKTSTIAIATLNILSLAKGKTRIEVFRREIADVSVRRAFAIISLSLIVIGFSIMLIAFFDPEKTLMNIAFECFSAYSTVGLSLGITGSLSEVSKFIIIIVMFVGRISMLSLVIAVFRKVKYTNYSYPKEEITIN